MKDNKMKGGEGKRAYVTTIQLPPNRTYYLYLVANLNLHDLTVAVLTPPIIVLSQKSCS